MHLSLQGLADTQVTEADNVRPFDPVIYYRYGRGTSKQSHPSLPPSLLPCFPPSISPINFGKRKCMPWLPSCGWVYILDMVARGVASIFQEHWSREIL